MERQQRFDDAKFGMFVHWGPYAVAGVEASWPIMLGPELQARLIETIHRLGLGETQMPPRPITQAEYEALPARFTAERFDPAAWVDLARNAGQRYLVLTTKHHDGFAMFDTATSDRKVTATPLGVDVTKAVADACAAGGMDLGLYFSAPDIAEPGYRDLDRPLPETFLGQPERPEWAGFLDVMEAQVRELCTRYGELFSWWWDIGMGPQWPVERFHRLVRDLQPGVLVNDRLGGLHPDVVDDLRADFATPEQSIPSAIPRRSTLGEPMDPTMLFSVIQRDDWSEVVDQLAPVLRAHFGRSADPSLPAPGDFQPWEACHTFGGQWAWAPGLTHFKTGADVVVNLVEVAAKGGNLLMNVGPRPDGTIQEEFTTALHDVGRWLARNGEGIYGTTFGLLQGHDQVRSTSTDDHLYLHLLPGAPDGPLDLPELPVADGRVLGADGAVATVVHDGGRTRVDLGRAPRDPVVTTVALPRTDRPEGRP